MAEYIDRDLIEWHGCDYEDDFCKDCSGCSHAECSHAQVMQIPPANVIPIPEGATNGDIVEKIFGKDVYCTLIRMMYSSCCEKLKYWWNAPYKKGE